MRNKISEWYYPTKSKIYVAGLTAKQFEQVKEIQVYSYFGVFFHLLFLIFLF